MAPGRCNARAGLSLEDEPMQHNATPAPKDSGTNHDRDEDDCCCTALMSCWPCYRDGDRGRPAIRRVN